MIFVVVVTYNGAAWIRQCLDSVRRHAPEVQTIVVDNYSTDDTVPIVMSEFPAVEIFRSLENVGFGAGNNIGIARALRAGAKYILLLNQDAYLLPETIARMKSFMDEHEDFGICSPLHCSPDDNNLDQKTYRNYLMRHAGEFLCDAVLQRSKTHYKIHGVNAAVWFVRAETFEKVGGFDPIFFMYGEDDDLLTRFQFHGVGFALLTDVRAVHLRQSPVSPKPNALELMRRHARRSEAMLLKHIKKPENSTPFMLTVLLSRGFLSPLANVLIDRDWVLFLGTWYAAIKVLWKIVEVNRHAKLTAQVAAHFLSRHK